MSDDKKQAPLFRLKGKHIRTADAGLHGRFQITLPSGVPFDHLLDPASWGQISHLFAKDSMSGGRDRSGSIIEVYADDNAFYGELFVLAVRGTEIDVSVIREPVPLIPAKTEEGAYELKWSVGDRKWNVVNKKSRDIVHKAPTKELAFKWITDVAGTTVPEKVDA